MLLITYAIPFTIEELGFVSVWIHEKGQSVRMCDDRRGNFTFKKKGVRPRLVYIHNRKIIRNHFCLKWDKIWRIKFFELPENPGRCHPDSKNFLATRDAKEKQPWLSASIYQRMKWKSHRLAAEDMCIFTFPNLAFSLNVMFTNECALYWRMRSISQRILSLCLCLS